MAGEHEKRSDFAHVEQALRDMLAREGQGVLAAYLFGSVARGTAREDSDVDLAVLLATPPHTLGERFGLEGRLEERLGRAVQVVILNDAPPDLVHRVLRDGRLVLETDKAARVRFEVAARNAYFDVLPTLERYRRARPSGGERRMTDPALVAKRLAFIETCLRDLATARADVLAEDLRERRFVEHTLQLAIQAALDVASHIVSDDRLGEPSTNRELFTLLARHGRIPGALAERLRDMAGFRNVLVHGYTEVDLGIMRDVLAHRLVDLQDFVAAVRTQHAG